MPSLRATVTRKTCKYYNFDSALHWSAFRDDVHDERRSIERKRERKRERERVE